MSFLSEAELDELGFASVGRQVKVSRKASIYGAARISIGDFTRIDDFCVLSAGEGGIEIGRYVHIAVMCSIIGAEKIHLEEFSNLSSRVSIYSSTDDFSGAAMTNPTVPDDLTNVISKPVTIGRHVILGSGTVVMPGVTMGAGSASGALSLIATDVEESAIYGGTPAKFISARKTDLFDLEDRLNERNG